MIPLTKKHSTNIYNLHPPGSSIPDPNLGVLGDPFRGENVTSIWVINFGHDWKKLAMNVFLGRTCGETLAGGFKYFIFLPPTWGSYLS